MRVQICKTDNHPYCIRTKGQFHVRHIGTESIIYWTTFRIRRRAVWILICKTFLIRVCTCVWPPRKCKIPSMPNRISIDRFYIVKNESAFPSMHLHKSHTHSLTLSLWSLLLSFGLKLLRASETNGQEIVALTQLVNAKCSPTWPSRH